MPENQEPTWQHTPAFADTHPSVLGVDPPTSPPAPAAPPSELAIRFTGSGSEYFRIWIVNLLLTLVTLGLYFPWAKVRRLRYFHGNTLVDGDALDFHGNPRTMLRGYLLVVLMFALYSLAGRFSATAGLVAFLVLMVLWPALWKSSLQFRLANTSWRGLRFAFRGSLGGAYSAVLPFFVPGLLFVGGLVGVADKDHPPLWYGQMALWVFLVFGLCAPWLMQRLKQYQHDHYALGDWQTQFKAGPGSFYMLGLKVFGMSLPSIVVLIMGFGVAVFLTQHGGPKPAEPSFTAVLAILVVYAVFWLTLVVLVKPFLTSRTQNLVWNNTGGTAVQFRSQLRFGALLWLNIKNWVLMVVTLGLYWPFAAIATARMRVEAVQVLPLRSLDALVARERPGEGEAAGDAAGDMFGFDIGL